MSNEREIPAATPPEVEELGPEDMEVVGALRELYAAYPQKPGIEQGCFERDVLRAVIRLASHYKREAERLERDLKASMEAGDARQAAGRKQGLEEAAQWLEAPDINKPWMGRELRKLAEIRSRIEGDAR